MLGFLVTFANFFFCYVAHVVCFSQAFPHSTFSYSSVVSESRHSQGVYDERFKGQNIFPLFLRDTDVSFPIFDGELESDFSDLTFTLGASSEKGNQEGGKGSDNSGSDNAKRGNNWSKLFRDPQAAPFVNRSFLVCFRPNWCAL